MSLVKITVPSLGESVSEATIAKWYKKPGDAVKLDELLVELETEKVTLEVNSPSDGVIADIMQNEGASVKVGEVVGNVDSSKAGAQATASAPASVNLQAQQVTETKSVATSSNESISANEKILSPAANKIATENNLNISSVSGSGKDGRVTKGDVLSALDNKSNLPAAQRQSERVKMSRLRKTIAQRLKDSQNTAAILTTFNEIDMQNVMQLRQSYKEAFEKKHGVKLGFMSFFVKAVINALKEYPSVNAEIDGDDLVYKNYYDIGIAVGTESGLVVPVLRDADQLSFAQTESAIASFGKRAREGKLSMADLTGGTFSITNGGVYGSLMSTPIINPPQAGILGMHKTMERPMAVNGKIEIRPMMYIALSYDHRIIDGKEAVSFLVKVKEGVENPERLLLDL